MNTAHSREVVRQVMPELDTLRGIAVLLVLFFHGFGMQYGLTGLTGLSRWFVAATLPGWAGVNLFFVLSGFLITGILLDSRTRPDYYVRFYFRRALRILPAYYAFLIIYAAFAYYVVHSQPTKFVILSSFYLANVTPLFNVAMLYAPLWTLAVEEHFYLLWPLAVKRTGLYVTVVAALVVSVSPLLRAFAFKGGYHYQTYTWFVADGLALGAILAVAARTVMRSRSRLRLVAVGALSLALIAAAGGARYGILQESRLLGASLRITVLNILFLGVLSTFLWVGTGRWKALVNRPILRFFGSISYGLYLIHLLVFDAFNRVISGRWAPAAGNLLAMTERFIVAGGAAIAIAWVSRWYFEERFLRIKDRWPLGQKSNSPRTQVVTGSSSSMPGPSI